MKYARIRDDGVIELRCGGETLPDDIALTDSQYTRACDAETRTELETILTEVQP